jgi:hypothetical protein
VPDQLTIDIDKEAIFAAFDQLGDDAQAILNVEAEQTAQRIANEARARIARRTGKTAEAIEVGPSKSRTGGYIVFVNADRAHIAYWLEWGTKFMTKRAFFFAPARLEEGGYLRRVSEALQSAIDARGLGQ